MRGLRLVGRRFVALALVAAAIVALRASLTKAFDPNALWNIVGESCVPNQLQHASPAPCEKVDVANGVERGYAVLKDNAVSKPHHYLLIPTRRITGIESPLILAPDTPDYFQYAWEARSYVARSVNVGLAWDMIGLAVNSAVNRSQNQLHVHVDCIMSDIRGLLKDKEAVLGDHWSEIQMTASDPPYWVRKLEAASLAGVNPFLVVADGISGAREQMDLETLVAVGAIFKNGEKGFYLLSRKATALARAHGEDLLDPTCRLANAQ